MPTKIQTVFKSYRKDFDDEVNRLLAEGWELHGEPKVETNAHHDTWDGRQRSWSETTFSQVLKINY